MKINIIAIVLLSILSAREVNINLEHCDDVKSGLQIYADDKKIGEVISINENCDAVLNIKKGYDNISGSTIFKVEKKFRPVFLILDMEETKRVAEARLAAEDIGITGDVPDFVTLGYKKLFDKSIRNEFSRIVSNARTALQRYGFNFLLVGSHYVPKEAAPELVPVLQKCREEFYDAVDRFIERYEERRETFLTQYESWRDSLEPHYPDESTVREKFYFDVYSYTIMSTPSYVSFDGLLDSFNDYHMGVTAENVAEKYKISRDEQDNFSLNSQKKTEKA